jgi:hypothetical protein
MYPMTSARGIITVFATHIKRLSGTKLLTEFLVVRKDMFLGAGGVKVGWAVNNES